MVLWYNWRMKMKSKLGFFGAGKMAEGIVQAVDAEVMKAVRVEDTWVEFADILCIEGEDLPQTDEEEETPCVPDSM